MYFNTSNVPVAHKGE